MTPEEKQRIYEQEKARDESIKPRLRWEVGIICFLLFCSGAFAYIFLLLTRPTAPGQSPPQGKYELSMAGWRDWSFGLGEPTCLVMKAGRRRSWTTKPFARYVVLGPFEFIHYYDAHYRRFPSYDIQHYYKP